MISDDTFWTDIKYQVPPSLPNLLITISYLYILHLYVYMKEIALFTIFKYNGYICMHTGADTGILQGGAHIRKFSELRHTKFLKFVIFLSKIIFYAFRMPENCLVTAWIRQLGQNGISLSIYVIFRSILISTRKINSDKQKTAELEAPKDSGSFKAYFRKMGR